MATYPTLIAEVCGTEKTTGNVSKAIPILIRWAQHEITNKHYEDLNKELGYHTFSGIGHVLGCIDVVMKKLSESNNNVRKLLGIEVIEGFKTKTTL